jgi:hypothetical protein
LTFRHVQSTGARLSARGAVAGGYRWGGRVWRPMEMPEAILRLRLSDGLCRLVLVCAPCVWPLPWLAAPGAWHRAPIS